MPKKIVKWEPENFELEMTTHWSFPKRGDWATHDAKWRGNWSPYIPRNILLRYSQEGDWVLDQFAGGGTTLVEAKLVHIKWTPQSLSLCLERFCSHDSGDQKFEVSFGQAIMSQEQWNEFASKDTLLVIEKETIAAKEDQPLFFDPPKAV